MKHKILWLMVSLLLVAALVLASCGPAVPGEQEEEEEEEPVGEQEEEEEPVGEQEEEEEPVAGEPQHGGTFTYVFGGVESGPPSWDLADGSYSCIRYQGWFMEWLSVGDFVKYGPRGTNEFPWKFCCYLPPQYMVGNLAESWEVSADPLGVTFHIRPGVMWTGNANIGMEPREYTASDAAFVINRGRSAAPRGPQWQFYLVEDGAEALDKYTLWVPFTEPMSTWQHSFGGGLFGAHYPPEVVEAGASDWKNQVGTGPFILTDYVEGSQAVYERNPNWWNREQIINGKEYEVPFVDKVIIPSIADESTTIAALWTGKIDCARNIATRYETTFSSVAPELIMEKVLSGGANLGKWISAPGQGPFADKDLRRAMTIGTDYPALIKGVYDEGEINSWPFDPNMSGMYTPLEEFPPEDRELYTYDPDKARTMIINAGYTDGLEVNIHFMSGQPYYDDHAALLKDMWAKIGVEATLVPHDVALHGHMESQGAFSSNGVLLTGDGNAEPPVMTSYGVRDYIALSHDAQFKEMLSDCFAEMDPVKAAPLWKKTAQYAFSSAIYLPLGTPLTLDVWWPWVKNYYGEMNVNWLSMSPVAAQLWIDQDLKAEMGH